MRRFLWRCLRLFYRVQGTDAGLNRRMSLIEYDYVDNVDDEDDNELDSIDPPVHEKGNEDNIEDDLHKNDIPDEVFSNVLYTMMIGITADKYNLLEPDLHTDKDVFENTNIADTN